jgi:hypothetical protein
VKGEVDPDSPVPFLNVGEPEQACIGNIGADCKADYYGEYLDVLAKSSSVKKIRHLEVEYIIETNIAAFEREDDHTPKEKPEQGKDQTAQNRDIYGSPDILLYRHPHAGRDYITMQAMVGD